jgi:hypothetical protein
MQKIIIDAIAKIAIPPQNGAVTHHQDQVITPRSLSAIRAMPSNPIVDISFFPVF